MYRLNVTSYWYRLSFSQRMIGPLYRNSSITAVRTETRKSVVVMDGVERASGREDVDSEGGDWREAGVVSIAMFVGRVIVATRRGELGAVLAQRSGRGGRWIG